MMDAFTAKTTEIRRLHAVCRAKDAAVRRALEHHAGLARSANHMAISLRSKQAYDDSYQAFALRDGFIYTARVLKEILTTMEG